MWTLATVSSVARGVSVVGYQHTPVAVPQLDVLMLCGFLCAFATLVAWLHQNISTGFTGAFAVCLAGMAVFAFLQGAWPLGIVQAVWSGTVVRRWRQEKKRVRQFGRKLRHKVGSSHDWMNESRISRMFGKS